MFYKNACWAVICYPICVTNVSYERKIIVLPFPVISFVILIFVSQIFEIKSVFPFYWLTLYTMYMYVCLQATKTGFIEETAKYFDVGVDNSIFMKSKFNQFKQCCIDST